MGERERERGVNETVLTAGLPFAGVRTRLLRTLLAGSPSLTSGMQRSPSWWCVKPRLWRKTLARTTRRSRNGTPSPRLLMKDQYVIGHYFLAFFPFFLFLFSFLFCVDSFFCSYRYSFGVFYCIAAQDCACSCFMTFMCIVMRLDLANNVGLKKKNAAV